MLNKLDQLYIDRSNWRTCKLGDIASEMSVRVDNPSTSKYVRFVGLDHFKSGELKIRQWSTTNNLTSSAKAFQKGDVLFARRNAYLRRASIVEFDGCCSGDAFVLRENIEKIIPGFLVFLVNSDALWEYAISNAAGTMSKRVKWENLANFEFKLPPKEQQSNLAELLWVTNDIVETNFIVLDKLNSFKYKVCEFFFIRGFKSKKTKKFAMFEIPDHWSIKKISSVANVEYGISESVANNTDPNIGWQIITGANINLDGTFDLSKKRYIEIPKNERFFLKKGDLMFNWRSGSPEHIGKTAFFDLDGNFTFASFILKIRCGEELNKMFTYYLLNFLRVIEFFTKNVAKQVNFKLNANIFRDIDIPIPPLVEQEEILLKLSKVDLAIKNASLKIESSKKLQKNLINQLF